MKKCLGKRCLYFLALMFSLNLTYASANDSFNPDAISPDSVNLSVKSFYNSFISEKPMERESAKLYLLGVMDVTEGDTWCNYRTFKTVTIRARIYEELKNLDGEDLEERASHRITDILRQHFPCRRQK